MQQTVIKIRRGQQLEDAIKELELNVYKLLIILKLNIRKLLIMGTAKLRRSMLGFTQQ